MALHLVVPSNKNLSFLTKQTGGTHSSKAENFLFEDYENEVRLIEIKKIEAKRSK